MKPSELLSTADKWCKGSYARNSRGQRVGTEDPGAVTFCTVGAFWRCYGTSKDVDAACRKLSKIIGIDVTSWNDHEDRIHPEIVKALRLAGM